MKNILLFLLVAMLLLPLLSRGACSDSEDGLTNNNNEVCIENPLTNGEGGEDMTPQQLIGKIISAVLGVSGSLALLMFVYGGFTWMLSGGNSEKVTKGKNTLVWAAIGLVVIFSSYAMVKAVFTGLGGA